MGNVVSSTIFCIRNTDKVENGDYGRVPVAALQLCNVGKSIMSFDNAVLKYSGKAINFASDHINPLICVSSGIKVLNLDDKSSALVEQASALSGMFATEALMKKYLQTGIDKSIEQVKKLENKKGFEKTFKNVAEFIGKHKLEGKIPKVLYGVLFVLGSCTGWNEMEKFGKTLTSNIKEEGRKEGRIESKKTDHLA